MQMNKLWNPVVKPQYFKSYNEILSEIEWMDPGTKEEIKEMLPLYNYSELNPQENLAVNLYILGETSYWNENVNDIQPAFSWHEYSILDYALNKVAVLHDFLHSKDDYQDRDFYNSELLKFATPKN